MRRLALVACSGLLACSTDPHGTPIELGFGDVDVVAAGGAEGAASTGGGSGGSSAGGSSAGGSTAATSSGASGGSQGGGGMVVVSHAPPTVSRFTPSTGPWGTRVTITGSDLGSSSRAGCALNVGDDLTLVPGDPGIEGWTETQIVLRVPFPHEGQVAVETAEGSVVAGSFTPSHEVAAAYEIGGDVDVLASVSLNDGQISLALSTNPMSIVVFDSVAWQVETLPDMDVRPESLRLYGSEAGPLSAVALSTDSPPEVVALERDATGFSANSTGVVVSEGALLAGGPNGAAVWHLASDGYYRARPVAGVWQIDKGPVSNVVQGQKLNTAAATSDGALWVARALETGTLLNDKGAPFARRLAADDTSFGSEFQIGDDLDDTIVELALESRGRGLVVNYCGQDANAVGLGPDDVECRTGVLLGDGSVTRSTTRESDTSRHALAFDTRLTVSCDATQGSVIDGAVWAWPCQSVAALESDPSGASMLVVRHDGMLKLLRRR